MKNIILSAVAVFGLSTVAYAGDIAMVGEAEYAFDAEVLNVEAGAEYTVNDFTFAAVGQFEDTQATDIDFTGVELQVGYNLTDTVVTFVRLETNDDLDRTETVVGASFRF